MTEHKIRALLALVDGPLDHAALVDLLGRAPWFVRQDLDDLRCDQLVRKKFEPPRRVIWSLTERGRGEVGRLNQLTLDNVPSS